MNWSQRYATRNIPAHCVFCGGANHLLRTAKNWSEELRDVTGLPRPSVRTTPYEQEFFNVRKRVPIPWATSPQHAEYGEADQNLPFPDSEKQQRAITEGVCPNCGEGFEKGEAAQRWIRKTKKGIEPSGGKADNYPLHTECMRQARIFCPHLVNSPEERFESGPHEKLRVNAMQEGSPAL